MKWFEEIIGYEIFPYSFNDSNNDGIGDLIGIYEKLDYLSKLGINLIWLMPIYDSPLVDSGYDISDHYKINPKLGSLDDFKKLLDKAHKLNIKVIVDLVLNHTSNKHKWFQEAIKSKDNYYHDFYYFLDPKIVDGKKYPPCNWKGFFSESCFSYVESLDQYYLHIFDKTMPDLNLNNPKVMQELIKIARFYLDMGVDGFRLDAISHFGKDLSFEDSLINIDENNLAFDPSKFSNRDNLFEYLKIFKENIFKDCFTVGEVGGCASCEEALRYANFKDGYINMVFNFDTCFENGAYGSIGKKDEEIKTNLKNLKLLLKKWYDKCHNKCLMPFYWHNHDHPRVLSQYGSLKYRKESAKMLGLVLLFMYGAPFIYQGEEMGFSNADYDDISDYKDVGDINFLRENGHKYDEKTLKEFFRRCSRISARTPMIWKNEEVYGGFSKSLPHIKINKRDIAYNVSDSLNDEDSIFYFYQKAIKLRKQYNSFIQESKLNFVDLEHDKLLILEYEKDEKLLVIANFFEEKIEYFIDLKDYEVLLHNKKDFNYKNQSLSIEPFEAFLIKVN